MHSTVSLGAPASMWITLYFEIVDKVVVLQTNLLVDICADFLASKQLTAPCMHASDLAYLCFGNTSRQVLSGAWLTKGMKAT